MDQQLKERLVGIIVLVLFAVIFIPMFFSEPIDLVSKEKTNLSNSKESEFVSKLKPVDDSTQEFDTKRIEYDTVTEETPQTVTEETPQTVTEETPQTVTEETPQTVTEESTDLVNEETAFRKESLTENQMGQMNWIVQIGSYSNKENAEKENLRAKNAGFRSFINPITQNNKIMYQVCLGPEYDELDANKLREEIKKKIKLENEPIVKKYP